MMGGREGGWGEGRDDGREGGRVGGREGWREGGERERSTRKKQKIKDIGILGNNVSGRSTIS